MRPDLLERMNVLEVNANAVIPSEQSKTLLAIGCRNEWEGGLVSKSLESISVFAKKTVHAVSVLILPASYLAYLIINQPEYIVITNYNVRVGSAITFVEMLFLIRTNYYLMKVAVEAKKPGKNPFSIMCYICGRDYGSKSIQIHEPKCLQEWERQNASLPRSLQKSAPVRVMDLPLTNPKEIAVYNASAFQDYKQNTLVPCEVCNRRFLPSSLERHAKVCKPGGFFERHSPLKKTG